MLYNLVSIEVPVYITVANIEAPTGAHAIAEVTNLLDIKALLDGVQRQYLPESKPGSIVSITSNNIITCGYAGINHDSNVQFKCTYGINSSGNIYPSKFSSREELLDAYKLALTALEDVCQNQDIDSAKRMAITVLEKLNEYRFHVQLITPEEQLALYLNKDDNLQQSDPNKESDLIQDTDKPDEYSFVKKMKSLLNDFSSKTIVFKSPVFIASDTQRQNDDSEKNGFSIQFGEIGIFNDEKLIGAIGTWKEFANSTITYFDDESDISVAREVLLHSNNLPSFFHEKPNLPDKLECSFDFSKEQ